MYNIPHKNLIYKSVHMYVIFVACAYVCRLLKFLNLSTCEENNQIDCRLIVYFTGQYNRTFLR